MKKSITHKVFDDGLYTNFSFEDVEETPRITLFFERTDEETQEVYKKSIILTDSTAYELYTFLKAVYD